MSSPQRPLRILHLTAGSDAGGVSRYIFDLCSAMHTRGHEVAVAGERGAWHASFAAAPWPWIDVPLKGGPLALWQSVRTLRRWIEEQPVAVQHAHSRRATLVARRVQHAHRPPLLYTLHLSDLPLSFPWRWFSDFGDQVHVASDDAGRWLINAAGMQPRHITLIPHGIDPRRFPRTDPQARQAARSAMGIAPDALVAAFVGRLEDPKNESWMLDLAAASRRTLPKLLVLLVGEGPHEAQVRQRIAGMKLQDRVLLLAGRRDPLPVYQSADALLLPSLREGFSLVCAEAMSTGLPVLRTRTAGTSELIVEGVTGRSTPIDHDAFLDAALEFLADPATLRQMGTAASQRIHQQFTFDLQLQRTLELYRRLADQASTM